jgi:hypothetical protein
MYHSKNNEFMVNQQLGAMLMLCTTGSFEYTEKLEPSNIDAHINNFVCTERKIPDLAMRFFEQEMSVYSSEHIEYAQSKFALYVLGRLQPSWNMWSKKIAWEVNEVN